MYNYMKIFGLLEFYMFLAPILALLPVSGIQTAGLEWGR
jgi:hypothetical protein